MGQKGAKSTQRSAEAGAQNLAEYNAHVSAGKEKAGRLTHGAHSKHVRRRYTDLRTREGKQLEGVMQGLISDLGGQAELTSAQLLLLDNIRSKLIVLFQISKYVDEQPSIITEKGELLPCLGRGYTTYAEALRRDLEALFAIRKRPATPSYEKTLRALQGGKA